MVTARAAELVNHYVTAVGGMRFAAMHARRQSISLALTTALAFAFSGCKPADTTNTPRVDTNAPPLATLNFPWPPPEASASMALPKEFLRGATNLSRADAVLSSALIICGYAERSYYHVPGGFALVTRLEQINPDGSPKPLPHRWSVDANPTEKFTLAGYMKDLATAVPGRFRVLVFVVSANSFTEAPRTTTPQWPTNGVNTLPNTIGDAAYSNKHTCTVLIYEFDLPDVTSSPVLVKPSGLSCKLHLEKAMLWNSLTN